MERKERVGKTSSGVTMLLILRHEDIISSHGRHPVYGNNLQLLLNRVIIILE